MPDKRKAALLAGVAILALLAGCAAGLVFPGLTLLFVAAGFVGYVFFGRRAMLLSRADDAVFTPRRTWNPGSAAAAGLVAGTIGSFLLGQAGRSADERPGDRPGIARKTDGSSAGDRSEPPSRRSS